MPLLEMYMKCVTFVTGRVHARPAIPHVLELAAGGEASARAGHHAAWSRGTTRAAALLERDWVKLVFRR